MARSPSPGRRPLDRTVIPTGSQSLETSTRILLERARQGDSLALEEICTRYLYRLSRWATGRLPARARGLVDTCDLVQETLVDFIDRLDEVRAKLPESFPAYLRVALLNRIRQEMRKLASRPEIGPLRSVEVDPSPTPLEETIGWDLAANYETALTRLSEKDQSILFLRVEMGMAYRDIAEALGKPSADAARMAASRALVRLAQEVKH